MTHKKHKNWLFMVLVLWMLLPASVRAAPSLNFTVTTNEPVVVDTTGGTPRLPLNVAGATRYADYASGSGSSALVFTYTANVGDLDLDGIGFNPASLDLNGGTVTDTSGNPMTSFSFMAPSLTGVLVDYPSLAMDFIADADGRYTVNDTVYATPAAFLAATGGTFTRASTATYFDATGTLQSASNDTLRFDYDPATLVARGLLIEDAATNSIRNSRATGAVAGSPGTPPTHWLPLSVSGISHQIVGTGVESGIEYVDIRFSGTTTAGPVYPNIYFDSANIFPASPGEIATHTAYVRLVGGSWANTTSQILVMHNTNSSGTNLAQYRTATCLPTASSLASQRCAVTSTATTFTNPSTAYLRPYFQFQISSAGLAVDVTIRFGLPQLESGAIATSAILTNGAAASRSADALTIPVGAWYQSGAGTYYQALGWSTAAGATALTFGSWNDGTTQNRWRTFFNPGGTTMGVDADVGGVTQGSFTQSTSLSGTMRVAAAQTTNSANAAFNGSVKTLDTSWNVPSVNQLAFGGGSVGAVLRLEGFKYYPVRVPDAQLGLLSQ